MWNYILPGGVWIEAQQIFVLFVVLKSKLVHFSVNTSHIQCTELDTLQSEAKCSSTTRQKEGRLMFFLSHNLRKNSDFFKRALPGQKQQFSILSLEHEGKQDERQTVQSKQMKMNLAVHLAEQLEPNETHLLIHMVAHSDMAATERTLSPLPGLQV